MLNQIDQVVAEQMATWAIPGISIATVQNGEVEAATFGVASIATNTPVQPATLFQIGSISKTFTATLIMSFVDAGALDLDIPVIRYIPDLALPDRAARESITLRHLLTHTAGFAGDRLDNPGPGDDALAKSMASFATLQQQTSPGELWTYCNAGFDLCARIIEIASGQSFETVMRERILEPLGMDTATYFATEAIRHPVSVGHEGDPGELVISNPWPIPRRSNGAGGLISTASALLSFAAMHMNDGAFGGNRIVSAGSARAMQSEQANADPFRTWGLGWSRTDIRGELIIEHEGSTNGFSSRLVLVPARKRAIAILTNHALGFAAHGAIARAWRTYALGLAAPEHPIATVRPDLMQSRAGTYRDRFGDLILSANADGFSVRQIRRNPFDGQEKDLEPFDLRPISDDIYLANGGGNDGYYADFIRNPDGSIRFLRYAYRLYAPQR